MLGRPRLSDQPVEAVQIQLQGRESGVPSQFLQMLPYLVTMVALAGIVGRSRPPAALGRPLEAESRL